MKVLILASNTPSLTSFRGDLIREMIRIGHEVHACAPEPDENGAVASLGVRFYQLPMNRTGTNPFEDMGLVGKYKGIIRRIAPDLVLCSMIKPNVYGGPAARKARVGRIVLMVEGLGNVFVPSEGFKRKLLRKLVIWLYRRASRCCDRIIFLNPDDHADFIQMGIVPRAKTAIIDGIGVNMSYYQPSHVPEKPAFLMISRLLREKGVMLYLEAAATVKREYPNIRIMLIGAYENSSFALTKEDLNPYIQSGIVEYLGVQTDVRPFYAQTSVVVLPSYREGMPVTLMEAMACQRAIITTDVPGCRQSVIPGKTGLLIPPNDAQALADAMKLLIDDPEAVRRMGHEGHARCTEKFEVSQITGQMIKLLGL